MSKLVVLGSVNADHVLEVATFAQPGETLLGHGYRIIPGGKGANQAVAAARLGADIAFIACVGDDAFGHQMIKDFSADGIDTHAVMVEKNQLTGVAMIQVAATGENSICIAAEANSCLTPQRLAPHHALIENANILLMQLETPIATIEAAAKIAHQAGTQVVLNPAPAQQLSDQLLALVDMITPNETAANVLHDKGINLVLITLGSEGVWLSQAGVGQQVKGFSVTATDTTAAGDTFNGALLVALQNDKSLDDAIVFAHAAAAISVTRKGAQTSIPQQDEVIRFLQQHS